MSRHRGSSSLRECKCVGCEITVPRSQRGKCSEPKQQDKVPLHTAKRKLPSAPGGKIVEFKLWDYELNRSLNWAPPASCPSSHDSGVGSQDSEFGSQDSEISVEVDEDIVEKIATTNVSFRRIEAPPFTNSYSVLDEVCDRQYHHLIEPIYLVTKDELETKHRLEPKRESNRAVGGAPSNVANCVDRNCPVTVNHSTGLTNGELDINVNTTEHQSSGLEQNLPIVKNEYFSDDDDQAHGGDPFCASESAFSGPSQDQDPLEDFTIVKNEYYSDDDECPSKKQLGPLDSACVKKENIPFHNTSVEPEDQTLKHCGDSHSSIKIDAVFSLTSSVAKPDDGDEMETSAESNTNTAPNEFVGTVKTENSEQRESLEASNECVENFLVDKCVGKKLFGKVKTEPSAISHEMKECYVRLENIDKCLYGRKSVNVSALRRHKYLVKRLAAKKKERRERELMTKKYVVSNPGTARYFMLYLGTSRLIVPANQFGRRPMGFLINFGIHLNVPSSQIMLLPFELTIRAICDHKKNLSDRHRLARECPDYEQPPMPESLLFEPSEPEVENLRPETESTARTDVVFCKPDVLNMHVQSIPKSLLDKKYFVRHEDLDAIEHTPDMLKESLLNFRTGSLLLKFKLKSTASKSEKERDIIDVFSNVSANKNDQIDPKMSGADDPVLSSLSVTTNDCSIGSLNMPASDNSVPSDTFQIPEPGSFQIPDPDSFRIKIEPLDPYFDTPSTTHDYEPMEVCKFDDSTQSEMDLVYPLGKMSNLVDISKDDLNLETKTSDIDDPGGSEMESGSSLDKYAVHTGSVDRIQKLKDALREKSNALEMIRRTLSVKKT